MPRWVFCIRAVSWGGVVGLLDDRVELGLGQVVERGFLGQVAADPAVPVLVASALPAGVGVGEVGGHAQGLVDQRVAGGLGPVVPGPVDARPGLHPRRSASITHGRSRSESMRVFV